MNLGDKCCFKCDSKVAEISHPSARISTPEDDRVSYSSSSYEVIRSIAMLGLLLPPKWKNAEDISLTSQTTKPVLKESQRSRMKDPV